jgi:two-component system sensor histidine kinase MprB
MRTPLTSLRSNVELLRRIEQLPEPERQDVVDDVVLDIDDLADLARSAAAGTDRRTQRNIPVTENSPSELVGNGRQLERAIGNLVDNAVKYSPGSTALP